MKKNYVIYVTPHYYEGSLSYSKNAHLLKCDQRNDILYYTKQEAEEKVKELESDIYIVESGEYERPDYEVINLLGWREEILTYNSLLKIAVGLLNYNELYVEAHNDFATINDLSFCSKSKFLEGEWRDCGTEYQCYIASIKRENRLFKHVYVFSNIFLELKGFENIDFDYIENFLIIEYKPA